MYKQQFIYYAFLVIAQLMYARGEIFETNVQQVKVGDMFVIGGISNRNVLLNMNFYGEQKEHIVLSILFFWFVDAMFLNSGNIRLKSDEYSIIKDGEKLIEQNSRFKIEVFVQTHGFNIAINETPLAFYRSRYNISDIRNFDVSLGASVVTQFDHRSIFPYSVPFVQPTICPPDQTDCSVEFSRDISRRFTAGDYLEIKAVTSGSKGQFMLYFTEGENQRQALNFHARFDRSHPDIVLNAMTDDMEWGQAETSKDFPFEHGQMFTMRIYFKSNCFAIIVDCSDVEIFEFRAKNQLAILNGLKIIGLHGMHVKVFSVEQNLIN